MTSAALAKWSEVMATSSGAKYTLGPNAVDRYLFDPKRLGFMFARYKFAAKMLRDCAVIVDVGCGDGMGTATFLEDTKALAVIGVDTDPSLIRHASKQLLPALAVRNDSHRLTFSYGGMAAVTSDCDPGMYPDGICCLDVIEHIDPNASGEFVSEIAYALTDHGVAVIGTPSVHAAKYASPQSQIGHINLYNPDQFRDELRAHFRRVFLFSMNDELVHVGFDKMAHYLIGVAVK